MVIDRITNRTERIEEAFHPRKTIKEFQIEIHAEFETEWKPPACKDPWDYMAIGKGLTYGKAYHNAVANLGFVNWNTMIDFPLTMTLGKTAVEYMGYPSILKSDPVDGPFFFVCIFVKE